MSNASTIVFSEFHYKSPQFAYIVLTRKSRVLTRISTRRLPAAAKCSAMASH